MTTPVTKLSTSKRLNSKFRSKIIKPMSTGDLVVLTIRLYGQKRWWEGYSYIQKINDKSGFWGILTSTSFARAVDMGLLQEVKKETSPRKYSTNLYHITFKRTAKALRKTSLKIVKSQIAKTAFKEFEAEHKTRLFKDTPWRLVDSATKQLKGKENWTHVPRPNLRQTRNALAWYRGVKDTLSLSQGFPKHLLYSPYGRELLETILLVEWFDTGPLGPGYYPLDSDIAMTQLRKLLEPLNG